MFAQTRQVSDRDDHVSNHMCPPLGTVTDSAADLKNMFAKREIYAIKVRLPNDKVTSISDENTFYYSNRAAAKFKEKLLHKISVLNRSWTSNKIHPVQTSFLEKGIHTLLDDDQQILAIKCYLEGN